MEITQTLYCSSREEWRAWLAENHETLKEIWLIYYKKASGKPRVAYDDAVEEALCFGWIDSTVKKYDEERYVQRYSPRNLKSVWSDSNIKRMEKLIREGKMTASGLFKYDNRVKTQPFNAGQPNKPKEVNLPGDLRDALGAEPPALAFFLKSAPYYQRICLAWIDAAKRPETRKKRIDEVVGLAVAGRKIGLK